MIAFEVISITLIMMFLICSVVLHESESFLRVYPVGKVKKSGDNVYIEVFEKYKEGLTGLDEFSHVTVVYWFDRNDTPEKKGMLVTSRVSHGKGVGVFATCAPVRPNLIAVSHCRIQSVKENRVYIDEIDAFDNSPVLDIKCFVPYTYDKENEVFILPEWAKKVIEKNKK